MHVCKTKDWDRLDWTTLLNTYTLTRSSSIKNKWIRAKFSTIARFMFSNSGAGPSGPIYLFKHILSHTLLNNKKQVEDTTNLSRNALSRFKTSGLRPSRLNLLKHMLSHTLLKHQKHVVDANNILTHLTITFFKHKVRDRLDWTIF